MRFFWIQPMGLMMEDLVSSLYNARSHGVARPLKRWQRCLCWVWVGLWMSWTAPAYLYPIMTLETSESGGVVPVSFIGYVRRLFDWNEVPLYFQGCYLQRGFQCCTKDAKPCVKSLIGQFCGVSY